MYTRILYKRTWVSPLPPRAAGGRGGQEAAEAKGHDTYIYIYIYILI